MAVTDESATPTGPVADETKQRSGGGVQSIERAFTILETMADDGGHDGALPLAADAELPLPTIHRLVRTLVDLGYLRQEPSRQYALGPRLIRLGESSSAMLGIVARPHLAPWSTSSARRPTWRCSTVTRSSTSPRSRRATRCGCSPRSAAGCCRTAPPSARRSWPTLPGEVSRDLLHRTGMPRHTDTPSPTPTPSSPSSSTGRRTRLRHRRRRAGARRPVRGGGGPRRACRLALSVSGPAGRMTRDRRSGGAAADRRRRRPRQRARLGPRRAPGADAPVPAANAGHLRQTAERQGCSGSTVWGAPLPHHPRAQHLPVPARTARDARDHPEGHPGR